MTYRHFTNNRFLSVNAQAGAPADRVWAWLNNTSFKHRMSPSCLIMKSLTWLEIIGALNGES